MILKNKRLIVILLTALLLLLVPLIAMQFTKEVNWSGFDFIAAAVLLFGTGLLCEFVLRKVKKIEYRIAICAALLILLLLIWAELAVGIFGTRFGGQ
jgi:peptidoglycan/LPS O-acetylase OafA/YrhL